jgi:hypothetical protein
MLRRHPRYDRISKQGRHGASTHPTHECITRLRKKDALGCRWQSDELLAYRKTGAGKILEKIKKCPSMLEIAYVRKIVSTDNFFLLSVNR